MSTRRHTRMLAVFSVLALPIALAGQTTAPQPPASGVYLLNTDGTTKPLLPTMSMDSETHGMGKAILTQGFSKPTMVVRHRGVTAEFVITDSQPVFLFRFYDSTSRNMPSDPMAMLAAMQAERTPLIGKNPKEYVLGQMTVEGDARVASSKGMTIFKFEGQQKAPREFEVRLVKPLEPGEYAFFQNTGGAPSTVWAFSLQQK